MRKYFNKKYIPAIMGTTIEYYDISLYGYMAPVLIQVFLPNFDKLSAYFYYFAFEIFAACCQITGAYVFGRMGDSEGRKKAMYYSMLGTSFITFMIAIIPTYNDIGIYAAILFALCRAMQSFFLGGEYNGGAIYCLEHENNTRKHGLISGIYGFATVFGVLVASLTATTILFFGKEYFRLAYCLSLLFAVLTYFLRSNMVETPAYVSMIYTKQSKLAQNNYKASIFIAIALAALLSGILYGFPSRIFNVLLPIYTGISTEEIMIINCAMIVVFMFLLLFVGWISDRYKPATAMKRASLLVAFLIMPAIVLVEIKTIIAIVVAKLIFVILSAALVGPLHAWTQSISEVNNRYKQVSTAYSTGKLGAILLLPVTILLFEKYNDLYIPSAIIVLISLIYWVYLTWINIK
ncbi:MAG: MFS transporter [Rickettsiales bacterium]|jgi:MFS family permease|nr:MFS transporter [Rickettsiales bacterium]